MVSPAAAVAAVAAPAAGPRELKISVKSSRRPLFLVRSLTFDRTGDLCRGTRVDYAPKTYC